MKLNWTQICINAIKTKYECPVCPKSYETWSGAYNHVKHDHNEQELKEICSE